MQTQFLQRYAPHSLHLLFHPADTGNPNYDFNTHLEKFGNRRISLNSSADNRRLYSGNITRIDLESTQLIGGRVLGRVEIDLGSVNEAEQQYKILSVPYAQQKLDNLDNAIEFVRIVKQAVSAGVEADPRSLQIWASWTYDEIKKRYAEVLRDNSGLAQRAKTSQADAVTLAGFKAKIVQNVLTDLAALARELTAITASNEERLLDEPKTFESLRRKDKLSPAERRELFEQRYREVMCIQDHSSVFASELKSICSKISPAQLSGIIHDEETQFQSHMNDLVDSGKYSDETLEILQDAHERVTEQYSEGGVVSLHMSDGERFVVDGTLEDDVSEEYLPADARPIAAELHQLFSDGEDLETIDKYIELSLNRMYGDPTDRQARVSRTVRSIRTTQAPTRQYPGGTCHPSKPVRTRSSLFEHTYTVSVYPNREERQYVREVLDILVENMQRDFILRSMNRSNAFRKFHNLIAKAADLRQLIGIIQDAYQARLRNVISIKMFTALNTLYECKRANFESTPAQIKKEDNGNVRTFVPAIPVIAMAKHIPVRQLRMLASRIHTLPSQEQERVRKIFRQERSEVYERIVNGLANIIRTASQSKRMYLRFAFYVDRKTGQPNEAHNMIHLLTAQDTALLWQQLKESAGVDQPATAA